MAPGSIGAGALQPGAVDATSIANGTISTADLSSALVANTLWRLDGSVGTMPGLQTLGTPDNDALEFKVNNTRALRLEPGTDGAVNVIGGHGGNLAGTDGLPPEPELRITSVERIGSDLRLSFPSVAGKNDALQSGADRSSDMWTTLAGTPIAGTGGTVQVTLPNALEHPREFYRLIIAP